MPLNVTLLNKAPAPLPPAPPQIPPPPQPQANPNVPPAQPQPQQQPQSQAPQPQQSQPGVNVPSIVASVQTALNRGADPSTILQAISTQNPDKGAAIQQALSRGAKPADVLQEIVNQNSGIAQDSAPQHVGFIQSLVQSIARPFLRPAVGLYDAAAGTVKGLEGDVQGGVEATQKTRDLGYFGQVKPTSLQNIGQGAAKSFADTAGTGAEIAANFVGGEGAAAAGEDFIKGSASAAIKEGVKEGTKSGALAGFGSGLQEDNPTLKSVAEKTIGGGIGGGITGGVVTGLPALVIGTAKALKNTIAPSVETALTKAIKPAKNNAGWFDALKNVVPDIQETATKATLPIKDLDDLSNAVKLTKDRVWKSYTDILGPHADATIDGTQIGQAMLDSIDKRTQIQNPGLMDRLTTKAATYQKPLSLSDAEDFLQSANNELHSYYAKNKVGQKVAAGDPELAPTLAEAGALRDALYSKLNGLTGQDAALLKKKYGDLTNIQNEVIGRKNVAARQNPDSLGAQLNTAQAVGNILESVADMKLGSAAKGVGQFAASKYLQRKNSTDGLIQSAFSRLGKH